MAKPSRQDELAEDFAAEQDELQALALGADNVDDLFAALEGRGYVVAIPEDEHEPEQQVFVFAESAAEVTPETPSGSWKSIQERAGGDPKAERGLANWIFGKRKVLQGEAAEAVKFAAERIKDIEAWRDKIVARAEGTVSWFDGLLLAWHRATGEKKVELPEGKLAWEKARDEIEWDEGAALAFVMARIYMAGNEAAEKVQAAWVAVTEDGEPTFESDALRAQYGSEEEAVNATWSRFAVQAAAEFVTIKRSPIKDLLRKMDDGTYIYVNEDGEPVEVIRSRATGEVPVVEGEGPEEQRRAMAWVKAGEQYVQRLK